MALNHLASASGEACCEVQFRDGLWMLADPSRDLVPACYIGTELSLRYLAVGYGERWNGFDTPVVTRATLRRLLADSGEPHSWDGDRLTVGEDEKPFELSPGGLFDTRFLGWTFLALDL